MSGHASGCGQDVFGYVAAVGLVSFFLIILSCYCPQVCEGCNAYNDPLDATTQQDRLHDDKHNDKEEGLGCADEKSGTARGHVDESLDENLEHISNDEDDPSVPTYWRAKTFFPGLDLSLEAVIYFQPERFGGKYGVYTPNDYIKAIVRKHVKEVLETIDQETKERLMKRKNHAEFCLKLGINPEIVALKYKATEIFEKEIGFEIKTPILDAIYHMIDQLDNGNNPFGKVNEKIQEYEAQSLSALQYMGVNANPNNLLETIKSIKEALQEKSLDDSFMHGTTAANLGGIAALGWCSVSYGKHDFGPGLYCFQGHLEAALSYAFYRSWPELSPKVKGKVRVKKISKDNPAVVLFPKNKILKHSSFHVGFTEYPAEFEEKLRLSNSARYGSYLKKKKRWVSTNANELQWKHFVKVARCFEAVPRNRDVFHGWLHDSDSLAGTDRCQEPVIEADRWEQYCFTDHLILGSDYVFVELFIDWAEWVGDHLDWEDSKNKKENTIHLLSE